MLGEHRHAPPARHALRPCPRRDTMHIRRRLLPTALTALLALALGASIATALRSIEVRGLEGGRRVQASSRLTFAETGLGNATKLIATSRS